MGFASGLSKDEIGSILQSSIDVARDLYESGWSQDKGAFGQVSEITAWAKENKIPGFASGGLHAGGLRVVGERGWEVEATGPARIWNQQQLGQALSGGSSSTADLLAEVRALRAQVAAVLAAGERTATNTEPLPQLAEQFDNVTAGGNAMAIEDMDKEDMA